MTRGDENFAGSTGPTFHRRSSVPVWRYFQSTRRYLKRMEVLWPVRTALRLINSYMAQNDFDSTTLFCMGWYRENGWNPGLFGSADVLARAKTSSVDLLTADGVVRSGLGKVQLVPWNEYADTLAGMVHIGASVWFMLHLCICAAQRTQDGRCGKSIYTVSGADCRCPSACLPHVHIMRACRKGGGCARLQRAYHELGRYRNGSSCSKNRRKSAAGAVFIEYTFPAETTINVYNGTEYGVIKNAEIEIYYVGKLPRL